MKVKIKSFKGNLPDYLTENKVYEFTQLGSGFGLIRVDNGIEYFSNLNASCHLNGGDWEIVDDE